MVRVDEDVDTSRTEVGMICLEVSGRPSALHDGLSDNGWVTPEKRSKPIETAFPMGKGGIFEC